MIERDYHDTKTIGLTFLCVLNRKKYLHTVLEYVHDYENSKLQVDISILVEWAFLFLSIKNIKKKSFFQKLQAIKELWLGIWNGEKKRPLRLIYLDQFARTHVLLHENTVHLSERLLGYMSYQPIHQCVTFPKEVMFSVWFICLSYCLEPTTCILGWILITFQHYRSKVKDRKKKITLEFKTHPISTCLCFTLQSLKFKVAKFSPKIIL